MAANKIEGRRQNISLRPASLSLRLSKYGGFTLLEVLVALVIFGILTLSLSNALTAAMRARVLAEQRQEDSETVRGLFAILGRDLQSAYGSMYDQNSVFMTTGGGGGLTQSSSGSALLTFATASHRIVTSDSGVDPTVDPGQSGSVSPFSSSQNGSNDPPQQAVAQVRYDLNPQAATLSRHEQIVPNIQTLQQATPSQDEIVATNIVSLKLQFWDPNTQAWRDDWDFEQPNLPAPDTAATTMGLPTPTTTSSTSSTTSASSTASTNTTLPSASSTGTGDVGLPSAVQVTLIIRKANGTSGTYTTILPIASPRIQDYPYQGGMSVDPNATSTTTGSGTSTGSSSL